MIHNSVSLWAHTMFKNDARWLWYSVTSVIDYVDKLLLWDTGSTDMSLEVARLLKKKYSAKIELRETKIVNKEDFATIRQQMLDETRSDWFLVLDADEVWWEDSIQKVIQVIKSRQGNTEKGFESIVVPTINLVGDIYHYLPDEAGNYEFGAKMGHYNLRAIKRFIPGLHSQGVHGVWGWADENARQIQYRNTFKFINAPYLHASFLPRASSLGGDKQVIKRQKKLKFEFGKEFPKDFYYPEALFDKRPDVIPSPWKTMSGGYKFLAYIETPLRKIKRNLFKSGVGY